MGPDRLLNFIAARLEAVPVDISSLQPLLYFLLAVAVSAVAEGIVFKLIADLAETIEKVIAAVFGIPAGIAIGYVIYLTLILSLVSP
jgi:hypothetical protein